MHLSTPLSFLHWPEAWIRWDWENNSRLVSGLALKKQQWDMKPPALLFQSDQGPYGGWNNLSFGILTSLFGFWLVYDPRLTQLCTTTLCWKHKGIREWHLYSSAETEKVSLVVQNQYKTNKDFTDESSCRLFTTKWGWCIAVAATLKTSMVRMLFSSFFDYQYHITYQELTMGQCMWLTFLV